ncbi:MAG: ferrous iron transport protein A [Lentisphaeria bacterium]|nr:ferrous iron transport protein A [Lentisphaeria bacterium]
MNQEKNSSTCRVTALRQKAAWQPPCGEPPRRHGETLPLALLETGSAARVALLRGRPDMVRHMTELGFVEGAEAKVVSGILGNLIIDLKGSRLAIDRQMAGCIVVER